MSLLLQALQNAAKNRDEKGAKAEAGSADDANLQLEPLAEPHLPADSPSGSGLTSSSTASPEYAAGVMRANSGVQYSMVDWAREHYMVTTFALLALFTLLYAVYFYIQISQPGMFRSQPVQSYVPAPAVAPPPVTPDSQSSPHIAGLPDKSVVRSDMNESSSSPAIMAIATTDPSVAPDVSAERTSTSPRQRTRAAAERVDRRARPVSQVVSTTDSEGVEIIEIPAAPAITELRESNAAYSEEISVEQRNSASSRIDPVLLKAYEALQQGNYEKARHLYSDVLDRNSGNVDALLGLAAIAWKQGQVSIASQYYGNALEIEPRNTHAQAGLIAILGGADPVAAESKLKQLIVREPSGFLYFTLGNLYAEQAQWTQAQYAYSQAYQLQPTNADYAFNLAVGLEHVGQLQQALDYYRKALDLSFKNGKANFDQELAIERVGQLSARVQ